MNAVTAFPPVVRAAVLACTALAVLPAAAQEFGVYLKCSGKVAANGKTKDAHVDLALRRNSQLALVQSSDVLPAGEKMRLDITPQFYTMNYTAPLRGSVLYHDWLRGALFVWSPDLKKLKLVRMSVDRQSAALEGEMQDDTGNVLGRLNMRCTPSNNDTVPEPKF